MRVIRHSDPEAFLAAAAPMAARGEASASFFTGWAHAMKRTPPGAGERVYLATCSRGVIRGAAIQRDEGAVIIGQSDPAAAVAFAEDLAGEAAEVHGVMGALPATEAFAGFNDAAPAFARIAPVYTVPERRGRGYATSLVAHISRALLARGKRMLYLTTDVANPTSNAIYARIGFRAENDDWHYDFVAPAK